jgi:hypothetical protein
MLSQKTDTESVQAIESKPLKTSDQNPVAVKGLDTLGVALPPIHVGLSSSDVPQLKRLAEYEKSAGGAVASGMMIFTGIPSSQSTAQSAASDLAKSILNFAKYGIEPIVIMEPTVNGRTVNFASYRNGIYDSALSKYFEGLKTSGITDSQMGTWVYFPEANLPEWGPVDIADFAPNVVKTVNIQKNYFPSSKSSIMLDAESYPASSTDWGSGSYSSLAPFVNGIPKGMLDSFGLQGFPWSPAANQSGDASYNPDVYLNNFLAAQAAQLLGVSNIWLNTGTFAAMYTGNKSQTVYMDSAKREALLSGVFAQARDLKNAGFSVAVNLFSEDKSNTTEATDWSYSSAGDQTVFKTFSQQLYASGINLWLFDS